MKFIKKHKKLVIVMVILIFCVIVVIVNVKQNTDEGAIWGFGSNTGLPVEVETVKCRDVASSVSATGFIVPLTSVDISSRISGEIVETGKNVTGLKEGDSVIVEDCSMCGICADCKSGHPELCRNMYDMEGQPGMGDYLSVRYNSLDKYDGLDHIAACLTEPLNFPTAKN